MESPLTNKIPLNAVLFDLDGTLFDTAPDLAYALNTLLTKYKKSPLPFSVIRPQAGHGGKGLIKLGFGINEEHSEFISLWQELLNIYSFHLTRETNLFPGMLQVLDFIEQQQLQWGIVTNKPAWLTQPVLDKFNLTPRTKCIVCGDSLPQRKPDPEPMWHACELIKCNVNECLYIGDAERDMQSAKRAGLYGLIASFGYLSENDQPELWGGDAIIHEPKAIINWLEAHAQFPAQKIA